MKNWYELKLWNKYLLVEPGTISKYESSIIEPSIESLKKLSETFNVTIDELLKEDEEKFDISKINILEVLREQKEMCTKMAEKLLEACLFLCIVTSL